MKIEEACVLINNLDFEEGLRRKFSPRHSLVQLARSGEIEAVYRFKRTPSEEEYSTALHDHPGTIQFPAEVGMYPDVESLQEAINRRMWCFDKKNSSPDKG